MFLVKVLFDNLEPHLGISLEKRLLPEQLTVVVHGGQAE